LNSNHKFRKNICTREEEEGEGAIEVTAREGPLREEEAEGARVLVQMP